MRIPGVDFKTTSGRVILVGVSVVIIGAIFGGYTQFFMKNEANAVKILSMDLSISDDAENFVVTVQIQNTGSSNVQNAQLHVIFIRDNDLVDSETQPLSLETELQHTSQAYFPNIPLQTESTYKAIATIYLDNAFLDSKTITKKY